MFFFLRLCYRWYKYDDHEVLEVGQNTVKSQCSNAYLLFYVSVNAEKHLKG